MLSTEKAFLFARYTRPVKLTGVADVTRERSQCRMTCNSLGPGQTPVRDQSDRKLRAEEAACAISFRLDEGQAKDCMGTGWV